MRSRSLLALLTIMIAMSAAVSLALFELSDKGTWPATWPQVLEPLRAQSRTSYSRAAVIHAIPFGRRGDFEATWPHILKLKGKTAPLILLRGPNRLASDPINAGVRILCPATGELVTFQGTSYPQGAEAAVPDGKFLKVGPPWPDEIRSQSGALPEYVVIDNGKWRACDAKGFRQLAALKALTIRRARTDIQLIVDGDVVDLNRIPLPADTPIVDRRFEERNNNTINTDKQ